MEGTLDKTLKLKREITKVTGSIDLLSAHVARLKNKISPLGKKGALNFSEKDFFLQLLKWIDLISTLHKAFIEATASSSSSSSSSSSLRKDNDAFLIYLFRRLRVIAFHINPTNCENLKEYCNNVYTLWESELVSRFVIKLEECSRKLSWPEAAIDDTATLNLESTATVEEFKIYFMILDEINTTEANPVMVLLKPLKKRFKYHFLGTKKTNSIFKPEWYTQQIFRWIKNSLRFFEVSLRSRFYHRQFCSGLLKMLNFKLLNDLESVSNDDVMLSHLIDEIITFTSDVSVLYDIESSDIPVNLLTEETVFQKWINLERKLAFEKVDGILLDDEAWTESIALDKVSKCTMRFLALLQSMTDRFKLIRQAGLKLKFVELQNELIEDLRLRLVQICRQETPTSAKFCLVMNSVEYVISFVTRWSEIPLFIKLQFESSLGLFSETLNRLDFVLSEMIRTLADNIFHEVKSRSKEYCFDKGWSLGEGKAISSEALPMLQILSIILFTISEKLTHLLFINVVGIVAEKIKDLIIKDVILENKFSYTDCKQLHYDIRNGFIPLFRQHYFQENVLDELNDVCLLLDLSDSNTILLYQSLQGGGDAKDVLYDFKIKCLTQDTVLAVISRRIIV